MSGTSSSCDWRIEGASRVLIGRHAASLAALDAELWAELGDLYADEPWTEAAFLAERPGKWTLSRLALQDDRPCGFWIASLSTLGAHTHRVGVSPRRRREGIMRALAEEVHDAARDAGARRMTLFVSRENGLARRAYRRLGYHSCALAGRPAMERQLCA